ncbi:hypothetical protein CR513_32507, partial [Mucuna pruriens]
MAYDQADKERKLQLLKLIIDGMDHLLSLMFFPYGTVELKYETTNSTFQVNEHQLKIFHEGPVPTMGEMESFSLMELAMPIETP